MGRELKTWLIKMQLGTESIKLGATIDGSGKLTRGETVKIRMNTLELRVLDALKDRRGFASRATTLRWLVEHEPDIAQAVEIVRLHREASRIARELSELGTPAPKA